MKTIEVELETYETGDLVTATVEFEDHHDSDFYAHGEYGSWEDSTCREITSITYDKDGANYEPTKDDSRFWDKQIEKKVSRA